MLLFHMGMETGTGFDVRQKFRGGVPFAARLADLQGVAADHPVPNGYGADIVDILHSNYIRGADVDAGAASDAFSFNRHHKIGAVFLFHSKGRRAYDLFAHPDAETTPNAPVGGRAQIHPVVVRQFPNFRGLRGHGEELSKRPDPRVVDQLAFSFDGQSLLYFQNTGEDGGGPARGAGDLHPT